MRRIAVVALMLALFVAPVGAAAGQRTADGVTAPRDGAQLRAKTGFPSHWWYGGDGIWGGLAPGYKPFGTWWAGPRGNKVLWLRLVRGALKLSGSRVGDARSKLVASVPCCYGPTGIQASGIVFPTAGLWRIVAVAGSHRTTFTVRAVLPH